MLNERPVDRITVKAIVEDCGINRNTFYYYFSNIPALLDSIVMEPVDRIIREHAQADSLEECLAAATELAREHKKAIMNIYRSANRDFYERHLTRVCREMVSAYYSARYGELPIREEDRTVIIRYYQCELMGQALVWLESGMRYDIQAQFARLLQLRRGFGRKMVERCLTEPDGG